MINPTDVSETLEFFSIRKPRKQMPRTGWIVRYDSGAYLVRTGLAHPLAPEALDFDPNKAIEFSTMREAEVAIRDYGLSMVSYRTYSRTYWRRLCRAYARLLATGCNRA